MSEIITQEHLKKYKGWQMCVDSDRERLARAKSRQYYPPTKESDGSQHQAGASDRMANAFISFNELEEKLTPRIAENLRKMKAVDDAIAMLADPFERQILDMRYIEGEEEEQSYRWMKWAKIAIRIYGNDEEKSLQAAYRLHGRALQNLKKVSGVNDTQTV